MVQAATVPLLHALFKAILEQNRSHQLSNVIRVTFDFKNVDGVGCTGGIGKTNDTTDGENYAYMRNLSV